MASLLVFLVGMSVVSAGAPDVEQDGQRVDGRG
jgi:hypothetical protein